MGRKWSEIEKDFLIENYSKMSAFEISNHINRTEKSVNFKIYELGLAQHQTKPRTGTLCWKCKNATNEHLCSWVKNFTPINGWDIKTFKNGKFIVVMCPKFENG